jgi:cysteine desulfurase
MSFFSQQAIYLDCSATTPLDEAVRKVLMLYLTEEFGNEGSRTHEYGARAKKAVQKARDQVAAVVGAKREEVIFTSGATESNNLALLGLIEHGLTPGQRHVISTKIEHKALLEPLEYMESRGFEVTLLDVDRNGRMVVEQLQQALRPDTLLVSVMAANNETGVRQPLDEICTVLDGHTAYLHTDAAQVFGKELAVLQNQRIDLLSISGHKIFAPKGVGALITRRRGYERIPLKPLFYGGGQERGLRPGTLPVALIAALGEAAEQAQKTYEKRNAACLEFRRKMWEGLKGLAPRQNGEEEHVMAHVINLAFPGMDSEALLVALKDIIAFSNGSACTSSSYTPSHVMKAMGYSDDEANEAIRLSWSHLTPEVDWVAVCDRISHLRA